MRKTSRCEVNINNPRIITRSKTSDRSKNKINNSNNASILLFGERVWRKFEAVQKGKMTKKDDIALVKNVTNFDINKISELQETRSDDDEEEELATDVSNLHDGDQILVTVDADEDQFKEVDDDFNQEDRRIVERGKKKTASNEKGENGKNFSTWRGN